MSAQKPDRSGILLLDKPLGLSSNAALQRVRHMLGARKAGHVGSLDPLATGMLPICLDEATKVAGDVLAGRKCYRFTARLGARTETGDVEGAVVETGIVPDLSTARIEAVLERFLGRQQQVPPMYSALKRDGQPLYRLARAGIVVERPPRAIEIHGLTLLGRQAADIEIEAICSKGTYIRTLAEDIARALGTCGHTAALRRLYVEPFEGETMQTLESIDGALAAGHWPPTLPTDCGVAHLPAVSFAAEAEARLLHGQAVAAGRSDLSGRLRLYDRRGRFMGIGVADEFGEIHPRRILKLEDEAATRVEFRGLQTGN